MAVILQILQPLQKLGIGGQAHSVLQLELGHAMQAIHGLLQPLELLLWLQCLQELL